LGLTGAVVAYFISQTFDWRICYYIGGGLGLLLLLLRISVFESGMFNEIKKMNVARGNFLSFFNNGERFKKYIISILIGLPTWYVIGVLVTFSDQFGAEFNIANVSPGKAIMFAYAGISIGDITIGFVSQWLKSRKKALYIFYALTILFIGLFFLQSGGSNDQMYWICAGLGFATGFWAIFVTMAAEQFGTNLRATAATTVPNVVRGSLPLIILMFKWLRGNMAYTTAGLITGALVMIIAVIAALNARETFGKDLNYIETI
jgi:putative MFS transporter